MSVTVMASGVFIGRMAVEKAVSNTNLTHTPPPTGNLPTFPAENKNTGRTK
jgi:hypothetical protein